jgi:hypothetical protein
MARHVRVADISPSRLAAYVRRRTVEGWPVDVVARWYGITEDRVRSILAATLIKGAMARAVCRRHADGETAAAIAEGLRLRLADVAAFLARRFPPPREPRPPREPKRYYEPTAWGPSKGPEYRDSHDSVMTPEPPPALPSQPAIAAAEGETSRTVLLVSPATPLAESWGPYQEVPGRRPVLDSAQAAEVQELAREGVTRRELAALFGCSRTTIDSAIAGRLVTRPAPPEPPEPGPSPATPGPAAAEPLRWRERRRKRGRAWRDD